MARIVILKFEDNEAAEAFVRMEKIHDQLHCSVWGLYFMPTSVCKCGGKRNLKDWGKAKKFGIPVCMVCKKPAPNWLSGMGVRLRMALGNNIVL